MLILTVLLTSFISPSIQYSDTKEVDNESEEKIVFPGEEEIDSINEILEDLVIPSVNYSNVASDHNTYTNNSIERIKGIETDAKLNAYLEKLNFTNKKFI